MEKKMVILVLSLLCVSSFACTKPITTDTVEDTSWVASKLPIYYADRNANLYRINLDGASKVLITDSYDGRNDELRFSPNGRYLVFGEKDKITSKRRLLLLDTETLNKKEIMYLGGTLYLHILEFSPSSDTIAIVTRNIPANENREISLIEIDTGKIQKLSFSSISRRAAITDPYQSNIFWSEDGESLYCFFQGFEPVSAKREGYADKQEFYELDKLDVRTQQISHLKDWTIQYTLEQWTGGESSSVDQAKKEIYKYLHAIPQHHNWLPRGLRDSDYWDRSIDGRYVVYLDPHRVALVLKDNRTGEVIIIDRGISEMKGIPSISGPAWSPDDKYIIYANVDIKVARQGSFLGTLLGFQNKYYVFVYDVEKRKKSKLPVEFMEWFDPNFKVRLRQSSNLPPENWGQS